MRRLLLLSLVLAAALYIAAAVELGAGVRSGPIVISSMDDIYVFVAPDDGNVKLFKLRDLDSSVAIPSWHDTINNVTGGIPSTGGHAYHEASKTNFIFLAPKGVGLVGYFFGNTATDASDLGTIFSDWNSMLGGVAVAKASEAGIMATVLVAGLDEEGYLRAGLLGLGAGGTVVSSTSTYLKVSNGGAYSTIAISDFEEGDEGTANVYLGTDEGVEIVELYWKATGAGTVTLSASKSVIISGVAQSGFAVGQNYVYFLSYGLDKAYFHVMSKDGSIHREFPIDVPAGEPLAGYPTNSPVVEVSGDSGEDIVYFAIGKAVYKYNPLVDTSPQKFDDIGETIYTAPVLVNTPGGSNRLIVVTKSGKVYQVLYNSHTEIPSPCAGLGEAYAPPIARGGRLIYAVNDGVNGYLCSVDISDIGDGVPIGGWPAFGFADGRTQVKSVNPPFKLANYMRAYLTPSGTSLDGVGIEASYTIDSDTSFSTFTFNDIISVMKGASLTVEASDLYFGTWDKIPGTNVVWYEFDHWEVDGNVATTSTYTVPSVDDIRIWKAYYKKKYAVYKEYINVKSPLSDPVGTEIEWLEAGTTLELTPPSTYSHVRWEIQVQGSDPVTSEDEKYTLVVSSPIYVKEYVNLVYGYVDLMFPKYIFEPISEDTFNLALKITRISTTLAEGASVSAFYVDLDLSKFIDAGINVDIIDATYVLDLDYPTNVSATTTKILSFVDYGGSNFEYVVSLATPISYATGIFVATLTVQYSGPTSYVDLSTLISKDMVDSGVGDASNTIGMFKVFLSGEKLEGDALIAASATSENDISGDNTLRYLPDYVTPCLGDFNMDGKVDGWDMLDLIAHYGLQEGDDGWDPIYDIAPRQNFNSATDVGWLVPESPRKIDFQDVVLETILYGATCTTK